MSFCMPGSYLYFVVSYKSQQAMNTGLVLSGGGIRGVAHIGAIKALEEYGIYPSHIAGTSAGAVVGALYANGTSWEEMLGFFKEVELFSFSKYARNKPGFIDTEKFFGLFKTYLPEDRFEDLQKPLYVTATDLLRGKLRVFNKGELIRPILASAAVPGVFAPVIIENGYYVDGGVLNNFPVDIISPLCDQIIGVYVNSVDQIGMEDLKYSYSVLERAYEIQMSRDFLDKFEDCDVLVLPDHMHQFNTFSLKNVDSIFELGYKAAHKALLNSPLFLS